MEMLSGAGSQAGRLPVSGRRRPNLDPLPPSSLVRSHWKWPRAQHVQQQLSSVPRKISTASTLSILMRCQPQRHMTANCTVMPCQPFTSAAGTVHQHHLERFTAQQRASI